MVQSPVPMAMELDVTLDRSLLATSVRQRLLAVYGAPLLQAGAERSADWHWADQGLLVCPAAQPALTSAAILTASPRTPNARQRLLVVHGATLSPPTAERSVDWHWVDQAQMACPAAQRALTMAAILPPNPRTPNARQRLLVNHGDVLLDVCLHGWETVNVIMHATLQCAVLTQKTAKVLRSKNKPANAIQIMESRAFISSMTLF